MKKKVLIIIGICVAVIAAGSIGLWTHEKNVSIESSNMPSDITVNGIDVSDMTKHEARRELIDQANAGGFTIKSDKDIVLPMDGTKYRVMDSLDNIVADEGFFKYVGHVFGKRYDVTVPMEVKDTTDAFDAELKKFMDKENSGTTRSADAYVDLSTNEFKVIEEIYGNNLDKKKLRKAITSAIADNKHSLDYSHDDFVKVPKIKSDSPEIQERLDYCNKYLKTKITYEFGNQTEVITPAQLEKLINTESGEVKVRTKKAKAFIADLAAKYDTYYSQRTFKTTQGRTVTLRPGTYGYIIDQQGELNQLVKDIHAGKDVKREPVYSHKGAGRNGVNDIPSSFVEVDLSNQHVYCYRNGKVVVSTPCVSGCLKPDKVGEVHGTVCGVFQIAYKEKDATLKGGNEEDETDYESEVKYWMPFYNGIGLHDADWRAPDQFGGNIYKTNGSHGCINLPVPAAGDIFNNVEAGTVVVVFY